MRLLGGHHDQIGQAFHDDVDHAVDGGAVMRGIAHGLSCLECLAQQVLGRLTFRGDIQESQSLRNAE
ncbi:hypothetical protein D3C71_1779570 [compost metagenome]